MARTKILIIDDETDIIKLVGTALDEAGFEVISAADGKKGLNAIVSDRPDLIISDVVMPVIDGFQLVQMVRNDPILKYLPFIMLSGHSDLSNQIKGLQLGADDYIAKPCNLDLLIEKIRAIFRRMDLMSSKSKPSETSPFIENGQQELGKLTFDSFVVGENNRLGYEAAKDVVENPGTRFNPLYMYGGKGTGKTHLTCAVANELFSRKKRAAILYMTAETFSQQIIQALQDQRLDLLRRDYERADLFLVDDIQNLVASTTVQKHMSEVLKHLFSRDQQIIITSNRRPSDLRILAPEICDCIEIGAVIRLYEPDVMTKFQILKSKSKDTHWPFTDQHLEYIAKSFDTDIHKQIDLLKRLVVQETVKDIRITPTSIDACIDEMVHEAEGLMAEDDTAYASVHSRTPSPPGEFSALEQLLTAGHVEMIKVIKHLLPPDKLASFIPSSVQATVVVTGAPTPLILDVVNSLSGAAGKMDTIMSQDSWAYTVHEDTADPPWLIIGVPSWDDQSLLAQVVAERGAIVFLAFFDASSYALRQARTLVTSLPDDSASITALIGANLSDSVNGLSKQQIVENARRYLDLPAGLPLITMESITSAECREILSAAIESFTG